MNTAQIGGWPPPDPTQSLRTPDDALRVAECIIQMQTHTTASAALWAAVSKAPLAALLYAGSAHANGKGIGWVLEAADRPGSDDGVAGWASAVADLAQWPLLQNMLLSVRRMNPRQRDSLTMTIREALTPWKEET